MKNIRKRFAEMLADRRWKKTGKQILTGLAGVVVFATIYTLILPAVTIDRDTADETPGIYLENADDGAEIIDETTAEILQGAADGSVEMLSADMQSLAVGEAEEENLNQDVGGEDPAAAVSSANGDGNVEIAYAEEDSWNEVLGDPGYDGGPVEDAAEEVPDEYLYDSAEESGWDSYGNAEDGGALLDEGTDDSGWISDAETDAVYEEGQDDWSSESGNLEEAISDGVSDDTFEYETSYEEDTDNWTSDDGEAVIDDEDFAGMPEMGQEPFVENAEEESETSAGIVEGEIEPSEDAVYEEEDLPIEVTDGEPDFSAETTDDETDLPAEGTGEETDLSAEETGEATDPSTAESSDDGESAASIGTEQSENTEIAYDTETEAGLTEGGMTEDGHSDETGNADGTEADPAADADTANQTEEPAAGELAALFNDVFFRLIFDDAVSIPYGSVMYLSEYDPEKPEETEIYTKYAELADQAVLSVETDWSSSGTRIFAVRIEGPEGYAIHTDAHRIAELEFPENAPLHCGKLQIVQFFIDENGVEQAVPVPSITEQNENGDVTSCSFESDELSIFALLWKDAEETDDAADVPAEDSEENGTAEEDTASEEGTAEEDTASGEAGTAETDAAVEEDGGSEADASVDPVDGDDNSDAAGKDEASDTLEAVADKDAASDTEKTVYPAQTFSQKSDSGVKVQVFAGEGAFPAGTTMTVKDVEDEETIGTITDFVEKEVSRVKAVDITFFDADGNEIEPRSEIRVVMSAEESEKSEEIQVVHVDNDGNAETVEDVNVIERNGVARAQIVEAGKEPEEGESTPSYEEEPETADVDPESAEVLDDSGSAGDEPISDSENSADESLNDAVSQDQWDEDTVFVEEDEVSAEEGEEPAYDNFSDDAVGETADEDAGDMVIEEDETAAEEPAAGFDENEEVMEGPGTEVEFTADEFSIYAMVYTVDFHWEVNGKMYDFSIPGGGFVSFHKLIEVLGIVDGTNEGGNEADSDAGTSENQGVNNKDAVAEFVADVKIVEFSDPELVSVSKVAENTTVGAIKDDLGLTCEYSAELSEEEIAEINGTAVEAGDWALISLKAFVTEEILTVTMKDGEQFVVKVTDAISENDALDALNNNGYIDLADDENTQFLHVYAESSVTENEQERDAAFKLTFTYSLEENVVKAIDQYNQPFSIQYDLNPTISSSPLEVRNNTNGVISIGSRKLGTFTVVDGVVTLNFTDPSYFDGRTSVIGYFTLTAETNESELGSNDEYTYTFPGTGDTVPIHYKKTVEDGSKSVNSTKNADGSYTLHYTANINVNSDLDSMTFNDTLSGLQTLDASSVKINGTSVSVSQTGNGFNFDVASALGTTGVARGSYQVTYDTTVTEAQLEAMTADKTTEKNTASWKVNGNKDVPGGETTVEINKPVPPIPVEKTSSSSGANQPGDTITYNVSYGDANTALADFHISDSITDVVIPQDTDVTLHYGNGQTVTVPFNSQATDSSYSKGMVTLFDYTFPTETEGNGPVTVTYSLKLIDADTAKENGVFDSTSVANTAIEHRQNTSDTETTTVTYEKEPTYTVDKTASVSPMDEDGHWLPGSTINYTLTIGDADTNMAGVNIKDVMTDLQVLQGDIMIQIGNGSQMKLSDYVSDAIKWTDDGLYHSMDVELFNFNMPSNAGNGPVVVTYTTKVISQEQASAFGIYGDQTIRNTGSGGKQSDSTSGTGVFDSFPIEKEVTQEDEDVNHQTVETGSIVHYTLTFGEEGMNLANAFIEDRMTDIQKLVSPITITKKDGRSFIMPDGTGQWSEAGNNWAFWDDGRYAPYQQIYLFRYRLPDDIGEGPITIEYDAQLISEDEAKEFGISGTQSAFNYFSYNGVTPETEVKINLPTEAVHNPKIQKDFNSFDIENSIVYWDIVVEKDANSAYPLENVVVAEQLGDIHITEPSQGYNNDGTFSGANFDMTHAIVTTDDGTVLTPGVDYIIDKPNAKFTFPVINERIHIKLAFLSPAKIIDGYKIKNKVAIEDPWQMDDADAEYHNPQIQAVKNGTYTEDDRLIKWEVIINPNKKDFSDSDPIKVLFEDEIPDGLTLVNYSTHSTDAPSIHVEYQGTLWYSFDKEVSPDESNTIRADIAARGYNGNDNNVAGLNKNKVVVTYYTLLSQEEWDRITSSASGSEIFENNVTVTAGDGEQFGDSDDVTVTTEGYLKKYDTTYEPGGIVFDPDTKKNSKNITYAVEINPNGYVLNSHDVLSLTDYISTNMDLDTASVQICNAHKGTDGRLVADNTVPVGLQVSYNDDSRLLSIQNIPDETPLLLTYTCVARAQGEDTFRNTSTLIGGGSHSSSTSEKHTIQTNDAGVEIDGIELSIHKIDENNISKNLSGAKFQLYECQLAIGELTNSDEYSQDWWENLLAKVDRMTAGTATQTEIDDVNTNFKIINYVPVGGLVETGSTGYTQWTSLSEHKLYAWVETEAPEGYSGYAPDDYHYFVGYQHINVNSDQVPQPLLSDEEQLARKHAAWALDDACQFANDIRVASMSNLTTWTATNVESHYTSITASKVWEGDSDNLFETRPTDGIQLQLWVIKADGTRETVGEPVSINVNEDTGEWPTYIWNRLPSEDDDGNTLKYTVTEKRVENYSTTYSDNGAGQSSGTITVTNRMIPKSTNIYVKKVFAEGTEKPDSIKVTLYVIKTDKNDAAREPEETSYYAVLSETNNWKWHWDKLPTTQVINGEAYYLSYTIMEDIAALESQGFRYAVSYSDNGEGVIETTENEPLVITNAKETGKITVRKSFAGVDDATDLAALQAGLTVTVAGKDVGGEGVDTRTLHWSDGLETGVEISKLPIGESYRVTESFAADDDTVAVLAKYDVVTTGVDATVSSAAVVSSVDGETAELVNSYTKKVGSLALEKFVRVNEFDPNTSDVAAENKTKADGVYTFNIVGKAGTATEGQSYAVTITMGHVTEDGVTRYGVPTAATLNGAAVELVNNKVVIPDMAPGEYTVTEMEHGSTICIAVDCSDHEAVTDVDSLRATVIVPADQEGVDCKLVTFTNNYGDDSDEDIAHLSVRKTFAGLTAAQLPDDFKVNVTVTLSTGEEKTYTLNGSATQPSDITFNETTSDNSVVWNWKIAIHGLNPEATVKVTEVNYEKLGFDVTTSINGASGTSANGVVRSDTVVQSAVVVRTAQNSKIFDVYTNDQAASIFIARVVPTQTALVISKHKLNLSERAAVEAKLKSMPNAGDWTNKQPVQYYSFEDAVNNKITARKMPVTYRDKEDGTGEIGFAGKKQWDMAATIMLTYVPGRPADFNFVNTYTETGIDLDIVKVKKDATNVKLPGAVFTLRQIADSEPGNGGIYPNVTGAETQTSVPTAEGTGKTSFANLSSGYYELKETIAPLGYVLTGETVTYFKISGGVLTWLEKGSGKPSTWQEKRSKGSGELISFTAAVAADPENVVEAQNAVFAVENTPGAALPNTGGPGTRLFTILGTILILGAGVLLLRRRRLI